MRTSTRLLTGAALAAVPLAATAGTANAATTNTTPQPNNDSNNGLVGLLDPATHFLKTTPLAPLIPDTHVPEGSTVPHTQPNPTPHVDEFTAPHVSNADKGTPTAHTATPAPGHTGTQTFYNTNGNTQDTTAPQPTIDTGTIHNAWQQGQLTKILHAFLGTTTPDGGTPPAAPGIPGATTTDPFGLLDKASRDTYTTTSAQTMHTEGTTAQGAYLHQASEQAGHPTAEDFVNNTDPNIIGQWIGTFTPPDASNPEGQNLGGATSQYISDALSGQWVRDIVDTFNKFTQSDEFNAWKNNTADPFNPDRTGTDGIADYIDAVTTNPLGTLARTIDHAGGWGNITSNPRGALHQLISDVAGDDIAGDVDDVVFNQWVPALGEALQHFAIPTLLAPLVGALLGAPQGALRWIVPGSLLGGILGALNPLDLLGGLLTAIPGAIIGALATGIPGLIASLLMTIPAALMAPLFTTAAAITFGLAVWATIVYTPWILSALGLATTVVLIASVLALIPAGLGLLISLGNPIGWFGVAAVWFFQVFFFTGIIMLRFAVLTAWIPTAIYLLGFLPVLLLSTALGVPLGLLIGSLIPLLGIPLITTLSAIPGAIMGAIDGFIPGWLASKALNTLIGLTLGAIAGALFGGLLGALEGAALGALVGPLLGLAWAWQTLADALDRIGHSDSWGKLVDAWNEGWEKSQTKKAWDKLGELWDSTQSVQHYHDLMAALSTVFSSLALVDGRRLRDMMTRAGLLGALAGAPLGAIPGALLGFLKGFLSPLNLLVIPPAALLGALLGGPLGAGLGKLLSTGLGLLAGLASIPLTFLPNLVAAFIGLNLFFLPEILLSLAVAFIPPLAFSIAAWILTAGLVYTIPEYAILIPVAIATFLFFVSINPFVIVGTLGLSLVAALGLGIFALAGAIVDTVGGVLVTVLTGLLVFVPVYLLILPLFIFPALTIPFLILASIPLSIPVALGMSILEAIGISTLVDALSSLLTVPLGALLGATTGAIAVSILALLAQQILHGIADALQGGLLGGTLGAGLGSLLGMAAAWLFNLQPNVGNREGTWFYDFKLRDNGVFPPQFPLGPLAAPSYDNAPAQHPASFAAVSSVDYGSPVSTSERRVVTVPEDMLAA